MLPSQTYFPDFNSHKWSPGVLLPIQAPKYVETFGTEQVCLGHRPCSHPEVGTEGGKDQHHLQLQRYHFLEPNFTWHNQLWGPCLNWFLTTFDWAAKARQQKMKIVSWFSLCLAEDRARSQMEQSLQYIFLGVVQGWVDKQQLKTTPACSSPAGATFYLPIAKIIHY